MAKWSVFANEPSADESRPLRLVEHSHLICDATSSTTSCTEWVSFDTDASDLRKAKSVWPRGTGQEAIAVGSILRSARPFLPSHAHIWTQHEVGAGFHVRDVDVDRIFDIANEPHMAAI